MTKSKFAHLGSKSVGDDIAFTNVLTFDDDWLLVDTSINVRALVLLKFVNINFRADLSFAGVWLFRFDDDTFRINRYDLTITTPWVLASLILYALALMATLAVTVPALLHADRRARTSAHARAATSAGLAALCLTAVVILMAWKP